MSGCSAEGPNRHRRRTELHLVNVISRTVWANFHSEQLTLRGKRCDVSSPPRQAGPPSAGKDLRPMAWTRDREARALFDAQQSISDARLNRLALEPLLRHRLLLRLVPIELIERRVADGVIAPSVEIEVPPFLWVDGETVVLHRVAQNLAQPPLFVASANVI